MPKFVDLQQGSNDWLAWREQGIGGSDTPTILGYLPSEWDTAYRLWLRKSGLAKAKPKTDAMEHGTMSEPLARQAYIERTGIQGEPICAIDDDADFIRVSADLWNAELRRGAEFKCPTSAERHRAVKEGELPIYHWVQCQHEMAVLDAIAWDYASWFQGDLVVVPVERDDTFWLTEALPTIQEFWRRVVEKSWPKPEGTERNGSAEWADAAARFLESDAMMDVAVARRQRARADLTRMAIAKTTTGHGVKAVWTAYAERYEITIKLPTAALKEQVLKALEPLRERLPMVGKGKDKKEPIQAEPIPPNLVLYLFSEADEKAE